MGKLCNPMVGLLFPGQGAQTVGMGRDLYEKSPRAKEIFDKADEVLGFALSKVIFEGPVEELTKTSNSQPAIFTTSLAALAALEEKYPSLKISSACGLSLGEFSALAALKVFSFEEGLKLVKNRGQWMDEAANKTDGGMVSIIGASAEQCGEIAKEAGIEIANINSPEQIVLSGNKANVEKAAQIAQSKGIKKVVVLNVSGAFHSSLMQEAEDKLTEHLKGIQFKAPQGKFISNVTGSFESDPEKIKNNLGHQVTSSVQWVKTLETLFKDGNKDFIELAPGKVLKGLARRTNRELTVQNIETESDIGAVVESIKQKEALHAS